VVRWLALLAACGSTPPPAAIENRAAPVVVRMANKGEQLPRHAGRLAADCYVDAGAPELRPPIEAFANQHLLPADHRGSIKVEPGASFGRLDVLSVDGRVTDRYCLYVIHDGANTTVVIQEAPTIDI
jgi:hypothetical protein